MAPGICLFASAPAEHDRLAAMLSGCGLNLWPTASLDEYMAAPQAKSDLCLLIDLPDESGVAMLEDLRRCNVRLPAILVSDSNIPKARLYEAAVLDVLPRTASPRDVLDWIECVCTAYSAIGKVRARI
jgi:FixJ family two-component response regulator